MDDDDDDSTTDTRLSYSAAFSFYMNTFLKQQSGVTVLKDYS